MKPASPVFRKLWPQVWYALSAAGFFFLFNVIYRPQGLYPGLENGPSFLFNTTMLSCILLTGLGITRGIYYRFRETLGTDYFKYAIWCLSEVFLVMWFMALYRSIVLHEMYFISLGRTAGMLLMTLCYPSIILTLSYAVSDYRNSRNDGDRKVRFKDFNQKLKFTVDADSLLYIEAEENYLRIFYANGDEVRDYLLRASMNSISKAASEAGLFRCQRSYYINPTHIKTLRKDSLGNINADLDMGGASVRVSRKMYDELSTLI